ncbi:MAG: hypothetical protein ABI333_08780 [bacterium]
MNRKPTVLFVSCNGPGRSQMAAALLREAAGELVDVRLYTENGEGADDNAVSALAEIELGADIDNLGTAPEREQIDLIVVIDRLACGDTTVDLNSASLPGAIAAFSGFAGSARPVPKIGWPVEDPALVRDDEARKRAYRRARFEISEHIEVMVGQGYLNLLLHAAGSSNNKGMKH